MADESQPPPGPSRGSPDDFQCVADLLARIPADEATVWVESEEGHFLEAIHNPRAAGFEGMRQPLDRGLISQVFVTGLPLLESDVTQRTAHDPTVDSIVGQRTTAMMAAPIFSDADVAGVLSAVQVEGGSQTQELEPAHLAELEHTAQQVAEILDRSLPAAGPEK
ncbi:MAG: GAF domain-containing protein [Akkermansiaceae bacterium]|nr:GAF domain-containing protein [Akkermansiaceae bacterium]NNM30552.1 GAF domain-containing protein [Akkermansiaceae bacterium]